MKKLLIATLATVMTTSAMADSILGVDFQKPINKQFAGDPYTTWTEGGIQIAEPSRGILYVKVEVAGFDSNGDTYTTGGFTIRSNDMADEKACQAMAQKALSDLPPRVSLNKYYGHDEYGCKKDMDNEWYFYIGGELK